MNDAAYRGRTVCVTGAAGFIGSHLCEALAARGARVQAIDDLSSGLPANLEALSGRLELIEASILDRSAMARAAAGAEILFHLAALASVPRSVREPEVYYRVNTTGTVRVVEAARESGVRRIVFSSSSSVYGDQPMLPLCETVQLDPLSPYAASKCAAEHVLRAAALCHRLSAVSLRYFNVFGPRQRPDSPYAAVIPLFADALCTGRVPTMYGEGSQTRDFTHVGNAVHANLLAGVSPRELRGEAVNIAAGEGRSVRELLEAMARLIGVAPRCTMAPPRPGDILHSVADLTAARELLDYAPLVSFEEGLKETVAYYVRLFRTA